MWDGPLDVPGQGFAARVFSGASYRTPYLSTALQPEN